ncbi:MAG: rRNA maturation RNase YbeY [Elusimicrobiaceae bacterium]|nr:rRNA maturation RNase YbeY [Elusimicrobiaceae bacterium]
MKINIFNNSGLAAKTLPDPGLLRRTARSGLGPLARLAGELNIVFVTAAEIKKLNRRYLSTGALTDVISFNYELPAQAAREPGFPFGDIFICAESARLQAKNLGHSVKKELLLLAAHGALHLAGMDDSTKAELAAMDSAALAILASLAPRLG